MVRACVMRTQSSESPKSTNVQDKRVQRPRQGEDEDEVEDERPKMTTVTNGLFYAGCAQNSSTAKGTSLPNKVDDGDDNGVGDDNDDRS